MPQAQTAGQSTLSAEQIGAVAWNAGIHDEPTMARAIAIALAESGGNARAYNGNRATGDDSYGLWQINMLGSMGPARRRQFDISSNEELYDPQKNAQAMWILSNHGKNWAPWSAFKNNSYMQHINTGKAAAKKIVEKAQAAGPNWKDFLFPGWRQLGEVGENLGNAAAGLNPLSGINSAITGAVNAFSQNLFKAGMNVGGILVAALLLILGVVILLRQPLANAAKNVAAVAPPGKVAGTAKKVAGVMK